MADQSWILLLVFTAVIGTADAVEDLNHVIASSTVAILFFFLFVVMGCVFFNCSAIYRSFGYERIPKYELKRLEIIRHMASQHSSQQVLTPHVIQAVEKDNVSWLQGWQNTETEERDAVLQLGPEEPETEYRIETTLVDNDHLGPYRTSVGNGTVPEGLYATVDKAKRDAPSVSGDSSIHNVTVNIRDSTELL